MTDTIATRVTEAMYDTALRTKYSAADKKQMLADGKAMKNANGKASYPIGDAEDLAKAIKAVGRGAAGHDAIRKHIIKQAKALGLSKEIPDNWNADGSLKVTSNSARADTPATKQCPTCKGKGKIMDGNRKCPTCQGVGTVPDTQAAKQQNAAAWNDAYERLLHDGARTQWRGDMTFDDVRQAVKTAIVAADPKGFDPADDYLYVVDLTDKWAVYSINYDGPLMQIPYEIGDDGTCTVDLDSGKEVARTTGYVPVKPDPAAGSSEPLSAQNNSAEPPAHEHRDLVPVSVKRSNWANPREWSWPVGTAEFRIQERKSDAEVLSADFTGYASTTGGDGYAVSDWLGTYTERMAAGAFVKTLREATAVPLLFNHAGIPLASYPGTSALCEDSVGLRNDAQLDLRSSLSNDVAISVSRGDLTKMSFSFAAIKQTWSADYEEREVTESRLYDTSVVTFPANPATSAMLRSAMCEGLGREGMDVFAQMRTAAFTRNDSGFRVEGDLSVFEVAFRALQHADEAATKQFGLYGRARTFIVGDVLAQARAGAAISAANAALLKQTMESLHTADDQLNSVNHALDAGMATLSQLLDVADPDDDADDPDNPGNADGSKPAGANNSGVSGDQGGSGGNTNTPNDGAGSRSEALAKLAQLKARGRRYGPAV